ncbi:MAG: hypothetical protein M3517_04080 [Actinomycetota bacterium]|nr:hypothetical protein [Actinomycetota bacterium]
MSPNNLVIVRGIVRSEATMRELASGDTVCQFDVRVEPADGGGRADVPVSWFGAPTAPTVGEPVVVVGEVRRRFYRAGGATRSTTDVLARHVVAQRRRARVARVVDDVIDQIQFSQ